MNMSRWGEQRTKEEELLEELSSSTQKEGGLLMKQRNQDSLENTKTFSPVMASAALIWSVLKGDERYSYSARLTHPQLVHLMSLLPENTEVVTSESKQLRGMTVKDLLHTDTTETEELLERTTENE